MKVAPGRHRKTLEFQKTKFTLKQVAEALKKQNLDPASPKFGSLEGRFPRGPRYLEVLTAAASLNVPGNPYYGIGRW